METAGSRLGNGKKSRDYLVTMVLHHNFTLRVCTAYCIVGHSPLYIYYELLLLCLYNLTYYLFSAEILLNLPIDLKIKPPFDKYMQIHFNILLIKCTT